MRVYKLTPAMDASENDCPRSYTKQRGDENESQDEHQGDNRNLRPVT